MPDLLDGFWYPLVGALLALLVTAAATPLVRRLALKFGAVDDPRRDDRRVHKEPIPKWGGIGLFAGVLIPLLVLIPWAMPQSLFPAYLIGVLLVGAGVVGFGVLDDLKDLSAKWQALGLLAAGVAIQFFGDRWGVVQIKGIGLPASGQDVWIDFGWLAWPLTALYIFVISKTMDTIDGVDGLASGIAAIAGGTISIIATLEDQPRVALVAAVVAGSCLGFLFFNFNPARIFLGTGGAQVLGFLLACLSVVGAFKTAAALALLIPILVFGVPLADALQVTFRRWRVGVPVTQADKRHLHHMLLGSGLNQRQTVLVLYVAAILLCAALIALVVMRG